MSSCRPRSGCIRNSKNKSLIGVSLSICALLKIYERHLFLGLRSPTTRHFIVTRPIALVFLGKDYFACDIFFKLKAQFKKYIFWVVLGN